MYQYTNTIVLNSLKDEASGKDKIQEIKDSSSNVIGIHVLRVNPFLKSNVCALYKRVAQDPVDGKVDIKMVAPVADSLYRIKLYVKLSGNNNSYFANSFVLKGKPFIYEFIGKDTAANTAKAAADAIKGINTLYGDKFLTVTQDSATITFEGDEFMSFIKADVEKYTEGTQEWKEGSWDKVATSVATSTITPCVNGFGTYAQMIKDVVLPTAANRRWEGINKEGLPVPGAKYNEYTVEYAVDRGILGGIGIGALVKSKTAHVFFVRQDLATDFETQLKKLETSGSVTLTTVTKPITISVTSAVTLTNAVTTNKTMTVKAADSVQIASATCTIDQEWLTATTSVSGDTITVTFTTTANSTTGSAARTANVTVSAVGKNGACATITTAVTQPGA